jgi:hypothetical protein
VTIHTETGREEDSKAVVAAAVSADSSAGIPVVENAEDTLEGLEAGAGLPLERRRSCRTCPDWRMGLEEERTEVVMWRYRMVVKVVVEVEEGKMSSTEMTGPQESHTAREAEAIGSEMAWHRMAIERDWLEAETIGATLQAEVAAEWAQSSYQG